MVTWGNPGCCRLYEGKETAEFQRSLQRLFQTLNQLMKSPLEGPTLLSQVCGRVGSSSGPGLGCEVRQTDGRADRWTGRWWPSRALAVPTWCHSRGELGWCHLCHGLVLHLVCLQCVPRGQVLSRNRGEVVCAL